MKRPDIGQDVGLAKSVMAISGKRGRITIRDVAKVAGVSLTTVSHALNGKGRIDQDTINRVRDAADRLGYEANHAARNLRVNRAGRIAVINSQSSPHRVSMIDLDHFVRLLSGATDTALQLGYATTLTLPDQNLRRPLHIDGVILVDPIKHDPLLTSVRHSGIPVVTTGRDSSAEEPQLYVVDNDLASATTTILDHLLKQGAKRIALIGSSPLYSYSEDAMKAYRSWTKIHKMPALIEHVTGTLSESGGYTAALKLLKRDPAIDAIHCVTDRYAVGAMLAAETKKLSVPKDILVTAGTEGEIARSSSPPITALNLYPEEIGRNSAEMLIALIEKRPVATTLCMPFDVILRESSSRKL